MKTTNQAKTLIPTRLSVYPPYSPYAPRRSVGRHDRYVVECERVALVVEQPEVRFGVPVEHEVDGPRPREYLRVLDRGRIADVIAIGERVALDDVQRVAVEVADAIEPRLFVEVVGVDDQRVAVPLAAGIAHPPVERPFEVRRIHEDRSR